MFVITLFLCIKEDETLVGANNINMLICMLISKKKIICGKQYFIVRSISVYFFCLCLHQNAASLKHSYFTIIYSFSPWLERQ